MSSIKCGEKEVTGCDFIHQCLAENFTFCHKFNEDIVRTGPIPRAEAPAPRRKLKLETGCGACAFFSDNPLGCSNDAAKSLTKLMTWPFKNKICKYGKGRG